MKAMAGKLCWKAIARPAPGTDADPGLAVGRDYRQRTRGLRICLRSVDFAHDRTRYPRGVFGELSPRTREKIAQGDGILRAAAPPQTGQGRSGGAGPLAAPHVSQAKKNR